MKQGWKTCKFADVFYLQMGKTPSRDNPTYWGDDNMWVSIADMNEQKYMSATKEGITDVAVQESGIKPIPKGTVIMSFKLSIGKVSIATSKLYTNEAIMGFIEKEEGTLVPEYLYYYLKGYKWEGANKAAMGMTLNKKTIAENTISYPPIAEQEKIVAELDCLSGIIEKKKQQLKELDNLAQSIFYEMFGDPVENDKGWEVKTYGSEFQISSGGTPDTKNNLYWDNGDISWIGSNLCHDEIIYKNDGKYITKDGFDNSSAKEYKSGYVLVALVGATIGRTALLRFNTTTNQNVAGINVPANDNFVPEFIFYHLQKLYELFMDIGNGKFKMANLRFIRELPLIVPSLSLQQDFASKIESIEKQKELIAQSIKETETLFNSRMDYYFG